jgi:hypothetical protein
MKRWPGLALAAAAALACAAPASAATILATHSSRLFTRHGSVFASSNSRKKPFRLGSARAVSLPALTSSYAALALGASVRSINLSTGAMLRFRGPATDLVLASDGSLAWIARHELHRYNVGDNADTVVDSGQDIQPRSLALAGRTIYWTKGSQPFSAPLR